MSKQFKFVKTPISKLVKLERKIIGDNRGYLSRLYCAEDFNKVGINKPIAQINHTLTRKKGTIRGMHFQYPPHSESKIVTCIQGEVYDVAVDLRKGSPTFLHWHAEILRANDSSALFIPDGFAHGFQTMTSDCQLLYFHTDFYTPQKEGAVNAFDSLLKIDWPLKVTEISERDRNHSFINTEFAGLEV